MSDSPAKSGGSAESTAATDNPVRYPIDRVLAVMDTERQADETVAALTSQGFLETEVDVVSGQAAADAADATTGRGGLTNLAMRLGRWLGLSNDEMSIKETYEQALRDGHIVIGVSVASDERKRVAGDILQTHGGRAIRYFGRFTIELIQR